ncbi:MAG: hypothetical protein QXM79_06760, partial [Zestosphaera sp.]
ELGVKLIVPEEPQIIGALGAALLARRAGETIQVNDSPKAVKEDKRMLVGVFCLNSSCWIYLGV